MRLRFLRRLGRTTPGHSALARARASRPEQGIRSGRRGEAVPPSLGESRPTPHNASEAGPLIEELRARNEFIQTILDNLPIGLAVNTIADGKASYANQRFAEIYGWSREDVTDVESFFERVYPDPEYREQIRQRVMQDIASGDPAAMRWSGIEITRKDGDKRIIEARNIPLFEQGLMISTVSDITQQTLQQEELRQLERKYQRAQMLESVGRLAGGIAHDFNNLLTVISSYAELAAASLHEADPLRADLGQIIDAVQRGANLTRQLLAIGRRQLLSPKVIELNAILDGIEPMLRRLLGEDIELQTAKAGALGRVRADPGQIEQVLMNLAVNARDAMPGGGRLTIETANVTLEGGYAGSHPGTKPGSYVLMAVTDNGEGMTDEVKERLFEPFFTTKEPGQGSGLGLATVYSIVKQTGGNVWVYSELGQGTTVKVYLPLVQEEPSAPREVPLRVDARGTETILVVEDEAEVRELARRILGAAGYQVTTAANAGEALLECEQRGADIQLLLTDVVMPRMSGKDLADRLLLRFPDLKVLYMSGFTDNTIAHRGVLVPGTEFIAKPFGPQDLTRKVREVLDAPSVRSLRDE